MKPELIVQIPPLQPTKQGELQAQARQGDMLAAIIIRPFGSDTYILQQYWDRTNRSIRRKLTRGQDERGMALLPLLRERVIKALESAGWQDTAQKYEGMPLWRYAGPATREQPPLPLAAGTKTTPSKSRASVVRPHRHEPKVTSAAPTSLARLGEMDAPVLPPPQSNQVSSARKRIEVPVATRPRAAYQRTIHMRSVTFTCVWCGTTSTEQRFPGPLPRYCTEACRQEARRAGTLARVQRFRTQKRAGKEGNNDRSNTSTKDE